MIKEFKEFISKGNAIDLAIGVIIGAAFGAIVASVVADLFMPLIGIIVGGIDFSGLSVTVGGAVLPYGKLIQAIINFLIIALVLFFVVKAINNFRTKEDEAPAAPSRDQELLEEIRDLLKAGK
ncbi:MAG TPA: large-conductance mechanosensitive channel protein MscL [Ignavibacteria bacterium]|nr:large-conductance mechanosensitive channel protein MscL [Ignavibacteria bacterium]